MRVKVTERSLYPVIMDLFRDLAGKCCVNICQVQEVAVKNRRYPDILVEIDGYRVLIQVKINSIEKLINDIAKSYPIARSVNADLIGILFPKDVRQIAPSELGKVGPKLRVLRGLILTPWHSQDVENVTLLELLKSVIESYVEFRKVRVPIVDHLTIAKAAREVVEELAIILRRFMGVKKYSDTALAIVGRFDYYKTMLEGFLREEEMRVYIADIMAYLLIIQLLFLHVISRRTHKAQLIPQIENPLNPPSNLIQQLLNSIRKSNITTEYQGILGALQPILMILQRLVEQDIRINSILARYIYVLNPLKPEHVREELFGRIYQLGLPPETRKNLGAFFTKPQAAKILARLAVEKWDDKVLDPAIGSGTLAVEAYQAKMEKAREQKVPLNRKQLHELFLKEHIIGIDIMRFAKELATINLALQYPESKVTPRIYVGDGVEKMIFTRSVKGKSQSMCSTLHGYFIGIEEGNSFKLPREGFNLVIMNPPFTRRERIPKGERKKLENLLGNIVRGKVGYWAYFFTAADNVIKPSGRLAAVTPEEFFAGKAAESIRRYLFLGEVYDKDKGAYVKKFNRIYIPKIIVKSRVEVSFSESALYRDYLMVLEKDGNPYTPLIIAILKKKLDELDDNDVSQVVKIIRSFEKSCENLLTHELVDCMKVYNAQTFILRHIGNLKPLVGSYSISMLKLVLELLEYLADFPTLKDITRGIKAYNPGQYVERGVEDYARRLFAYRYGARGKSTFEVVSVDERKGVVKFRLKRRELKFEIPLNACIYALRSPAGVKKFNITNAEEYAIIDANLIPEDVRRIAGLIDLNMLRRACNDIRQAYNDIASNILVTRRLQLTSPNIYWLAFYSDRNTLNTVVLLNVISELDKSSKKLLTLYLNSSVTLLQILAFAVETRGAWVALHGDQVWSHVHVPYLHSLPEEVKAEALKTFDKVNKFNAPSLYERIKSKNAIQKLIDKIALKMLGLDSWIDNMDKIYDAILYELDYMQRILEVKGEEKKVKRESVKETSEGKGYQTRIDMFL